MPPGTHPLSSLRWTITVTPRWPPGELAPLLVTQLLTVNPTAPRVTHLPLPGSFSTYWTRRVQRGPAPHMRRPSASSSSWHSGWCRARACCGGHRQVTSRRRVVQLINSDHTQGRHRAIIPFLPLLLSQLLISRRCNNSFISLLYFAKCSRLLLASQGKLIANPGQPPLPHAPR